MKSIHDKTFLARSPRQLCSFLYIFGSSLWSIDVKHVCESALGLTCIVFSMMVAVFAAETTETDITMIVMVIEMLVVMGFVMNRHWYWHFNRHWYWSIDVNWTFNMDGHGTIHRNLPDGIEKNALKIANILQLKITL